MRKLIVQHLPITLVTTIQKAPPESLRHSGAPWHHQLPHSLEGLVPFLKDMNAETSMSLCHVASWAELHGWWLQICFLTRCSVFYPPSLQNFQRSVRTGGGGVGTHWCFWVFSVLWIAVLLLLAIASTVWLSVVLIHTSSQLPTQCGDCLQGSFPSVRPAAYDILGICIFLI